MFLGYPNCFFCHQLQSTNNKDHIYSVLQCLIKVSTGLLLVMVRVTQYNSLGVLFLCVQLYNMLKEGSMH